MMYRRTEGASAALLQLFYLQINLASLSGDVFRVSPQETVCVGGRDTFFFSFISQKQSDFQYILMSDTANTELHTVVTVQMLSPNQPFPDLQ